MNDRDFRDAMGKFATGITIVAMRDNQIGVKAMTVNAFMSISLDPELIAISIDKKASMHDRFKLSTSFGVSVLSEQQKEASMVYAKQIKKEKDIPFISLDGAPVLEDSLTSLSCKVSDLVEAGDHTIVIAEVTSLSMNNGEPLLFFEGKYREITSN
ncbi:flavin reductase [Ornithinibacillus sp. L9]|uniref:Flavin reductase n=1 Tax=Ornithinibacillus caprae TaxID=2678566 RepID=A0A6N8FMD7_9BACI|nr:flavin reductase family protein [Ornithinibacillus caprae]MUK90645.1 flavin reductase [Ornithinibacillus caprae]